VKIPSPQSIDSVHIFWLALLHIAPSIYAFILSFAIILITWVNHHNSLKLVGSSCTPFVYANGFLLLTVAFIPFPTALVGEFVMTNHSAPAVVLFNITLAMQALAWIIFARTAHKYKLGKSEKAIEALQRGGKFGYFAFALYSICAVAAFWFPLTVIIITSVTWIFWLIYGIRIRHEEWS
jgi:uncharacterized membrane protein